jgi:hypothetical protein
VGIADFQQDMASFLTPEEIQQRLDELARKYVETHDQE